MRSSTLLCPYPTSLFSGFQLWESDKKKSNNLPLLAISRLSVRYAAPRSILVSAEILTGLPWIVTTAKVGLDSGCSREGREQKVNYFVKKK